MLAAGAASRMGRSKLTMPYGDSTVISTVLEAVDQSVVDDVVVVTGFHADRVETEVDGSVATTRNPEPSRGNLSSLRCGVEALSDTADGILVVLGDMPGIQPSVVDALVGMFESTNVDAVVSAYTDGWGHPMVVTRDLIASLNPRLDQPLWSGLTDLPDARRIELPVNTSRPIDINTPADHKAAESG